MHKDVYRLAVLLALCALATSRLGLVAHELVGHGGAALATGGTVTGAKLFWFAGGWIRYQGVTGTGASLTIAMAGIAVETVAGVALWATSRRDTLGGRIIRGIAAALIVHASWYLATGAWHGYGDGALLYHVLGDARPAVAIAAGLVTCAAAFAGAREALGALAQTLPAQRVAGLAVAIALAGGVNTALAAGELHLRRDTTYRETMASERDRQIADALARFAARAPDAGAAERAAEQARLEREHRTFPFAWLLGFAAAAAAIAGAVRARPAAPAAITRRHLATAALAAGGGLALVIALGAVL